MIRVVVNGILGRMGKEICSQILRDEDLFLAGGIDTLETFHAEEIVVTTNPAEVLEDAEVLIDFSSGDGAAAIAGACATHGVAMVTGTTGLTTDQQALITALTGKVAVVQAFNFSIGVNLLVQLVERAAKVLQDQFDAEIIELHHRNKKDAPSGTALLLARTLAGAANLPESAIVKGRSGNDLVRENEIAVHSLRGGNVVGEHQVHFLGPNESITLSHEALSRRSFVDGVMRAVHWIVDRKPGYYTMRDVLS